MHHCRELLTECAASKTDKIPSLVPLLWPLLWYRATLDLTDSSAQQAKTTQKNEPVQSCPVPVELRLASSRFYLSSSDATFESHRLSSDRSESNCLITRR